MTRTTAKWLATKPIKIFHFQYFTFFKFHHIFFMFCSSFHYSRKIFFELLNWTFNFDWFKVWKTGHYTEKCSKDQTCFRAMDERSRRKVTKIYQSNRLIIYYDKLVSECVLIIHASDDSIKYISLELQLTHVNENNWRNHFEMFKTPSLVFFFINFNQINWKMLHFCSRLLWFCNGEKCN